MEQLRSNIGEYPLYINSGYRCPMHNAAVGGFSNSQHKLGNAADIARHEHLSFGQFQWYVEQLPFDGIGLYKWPDGKIYYGMFSKGKKNGLGKFIWEDGRVYLGFWNDNKQNGIGMYINECKTKLFGIWAHGKRKKWLSKEEIQNLKNKNDENYKAILEFKDKDYQKK